MFTGAKRAAGGSIVRKCCSNWSSYEVPPASDKLPRVVGTSALSIEVLSTSEGEVSGVNGIRRSAEKYPSSMPGMSVAGSDRNAGLAVKAIESPVVKSRCFCSRSEVTPPINPSMSNSER